MMIKCNQGMDWVGRIFEGANRGVSWGSRSASEEFDRAIAIALAEKGKRKYEIDDDFRLKEDEYLAKALNGSLKLEPPPFNRNVNRNGNVHQPIPFAHSTGFGICAGCNNTIGYGRALRCMGAVWHPECLKCHTCSLPISDYEFLLSGNHVYHKSCYKENHHPKCDVCRQFFRTNTAGFVEYKVHPFWAQKYCPLHERDGTPRCCSCDRFEPREIQYAALNDGRKLCLECLDSAIMDTADCQLLYLDIQQYFESLNMKLEQKIPLLLVETQALNEAMDVETHGHYPVPVPETRGLCLSEEQTVSTVLRRPRIGIGNRVPNMTIEEPYKLTRHSEVTAILVLYGLPRLLTGSILAHEMMHAWLRLKGYPTLRQDIEEGICQVLAHMWLTSEITKQVRRSPFEKKLGDFYKQQIESDISPVYGNGFRAANRAVLKYGLQKTLYHMQFARNFPN